MVRLPPRSLSSLARNRCPCLLRNPHVRSRHGREPSKRGAHLMLQTRTRVLDDTLRAKFQSWYPGLFHIDARTSIRRPRTPVRLSDGGRFRRLTPRILMLPYMPIRSRRSATIRRVTIGTGASAARRRRCPPRAHAGECRCARSGEGRPGPWLSRGCHSLRCVPFSGALLREVPRPAPDQRVAANEPTAV